MSFTKLALALGTVFVAAALLFGALAVPAGHENDSPQDSVASAQQAPSGEAVARESGNAGLLGSTGTSMALVLALGVFAAAMVAGGRTATRRS